MLCRLTNDQKNLIEMLQKYAPVASEEVNAKKAIISFVKTHEDCFERSLEKGHITASAWLLSGDLSKVLLMHHAKLDIWVQLGGHCDGNPDVLAVAVKEAQEESGIKAISPVREEIFDIDIHLNPANRSEKEHYHYDIRFLLQVTSNEKIVQNPESKCLRWFGKDLKELPTDHRSIVRMHNKWTGDLITHQGRGT